MISRKPSGFTLLELLVVISIIAILAVSLTPAFSRAREAARRTTCGQNLGQIHKALTMYETDYSMYPAMQAGNPTQYTATPQTALTLLYRQYTDDVRIFSCPSKKMSPTDLQSISPSSAAGWQGNSFETHNSSYGYSPGHSSSNSRVIVLADRKGTKVNSDNHGVNAGQVVLSAGGSVEFKPAAASNAPPGNDLGKDDNNVAITDSDIFTWGTISDTTSYFDWDSNCQ